MQFDESDEQSRNAEMSIDRSFECASNATIDRIRHPEKQRAQRSVMDEGMQIPVAGSALMESEGLQRPQHHKQDRQYRYDREKTATSAHRGKER
jgi:hypothetical protein